jgi:hypothetical protein
MPNKTLYIRDDDAPLWERAELMAKQSRQSLSQMVMAALDRHLAAGPDTTDMRDITIKRRDGARRWVEGFRGRWLLEPGEASDEPGRPGWARYGVAETRLGRIAVYISDGNGLREPSFKVYDSLDEAATDLPEDIVAKAEASLGWNAVVWLEI